MISKKIIIIGGVVGGLLIIGGLTAWSLSGNNGTIEPLPATTQVVHGPSSLLYDSPQLSFKYDSTYQLVKGKSNSKDVQLDMLNADTSYEKHLAVAIYAHGGSQLDSFSPYQTRKVQPSLYPRTEVPVSGGTATVFSKADSSEVTVVLPHDDYVATLSFSTAGTNDDLQAEVTTLLSSFRWKA